MLIYLEYSLILCKIYTQTVKNRDIKFEPDHRSGNRAKCWPGARGIQQNRVA